MISGRTVDVKPGFKLLSRIDLALLLSQHDGNRGIAQILVLLQFIVFVCCRIGISSTDIESL